MKKRSFVKLVKRVKSLRESGMTYREICEHLDLVPGSKLGAYRILNGKYGRFVQDCIL